MAAIKDVFYENRAWGFVAPSTKTRIPYVTRYIILTQNVENAETG